MAVHLLHPDFFAFLEALSQEQADPWAVYEKHYLAPHRAVLEAWWEQVLGLPMETWADRVRQVRPQDYGLLSMVVAEGDLTALAEDTLARCWRVLPLSPEPDVYFLVGFYSPDAFTFRVGDDWAIGLGLERLRSQHLLPVLLAHEYLHVHRTRTQPEPQTLGERMVEEGLAIAFSARVFPERPAHEHLLMRPGQLAAMQQYETRLRETFRPLLGDTDRKLAARMLYGQEARGRWPSRSGVYLGWRAEEEYLASHPADFGTAAREVLAATFPTGR